MKLISYFFALASGAVLCADDIRLRVVDENLTPVAGAKSMIGFAAIARGGEVRYDGLSDASGLFSARGRAQHSVMITVEKPGHYPAYFDRLEREKDWDIQVVLPRIINPIPLAARIAVVAKKPNPAVDDVEELDDTIGFDLAKGEAVAPHGAGEVADILFKLRTKFTGWRYNEREMRESRNHVVNRDSTEQKIKWFYGNFAGELEILFPDSSAGIVEEKSHFLPYSRLKMPHRAPADGYGPSLHFASTSVKPQFRDEDIGYFIRTRVKRDAEGRVVSFHYAKVMTDFWLDPRGRVSFTYYFNPTPNDRNLEFDTRRNLLPDQPNFYAVQNP